MCFSARAQDAGDLVRQMRDLRNRDWGDHDTGGESPAERRAEAAESARVRNYNATSDRAWKAFQDGDGQAMRDAALEMLRLYPGDKYALDFLGLSGVLLGDYASAEESFNKARSAGLSRSLWRKHMNYLRDHQGNDLFAANDPAGAARALREAVDFDDHDDWALNTLGVALEQLGKFDEARKYYEAALRRNPSKQLYQKNLAGIIERQKAEKQDRDYKAHDASIADNASRRIAQWARLVSRAPSAELAAGNLAPVPSSQAAAMEAWTDPNVVDLRGASGSTPHLLRGSDAGSGLPSTFKSDLQIPAPPGPNVQLPQPRDIAFLFDAQPAASRWPGPKRPANEPHIVPDAATQAYLDAQKREHMPKDSDIEYLFPKSPAEQEEEELFNGILEMAEKEKWPDRAAIPPQPAPPPPPKSPPDSLSPQDQPGPHN